VHLHAASKRHLLELFTLGVPVYRQRFHTEVSLPSRERFYRLARACCARAELLCQPSGSLSDSKNAHHEEKGARALTPAALQDSIVVVVTVDKGRICAVPLAAEQDSLAWREIALRVRPGGLCYTADQQQAFASLPVRGDRVIVRERAMRLMNSEQVDAIQAFWRYAKHWLSTYQSVPRKFFHLYLGELCFRYNHHGENIMPLLRCLLEHTNIQDLKPLMTAGTRVAYDRSDAA
jgi:transposase